MKNDPVSSPAVVFSEFGIPTQVASFGAVDCRVIGAEDALVEIEAAPINPADLNVLEGRYGTLPALPAVPGAEGVGRVRQVGEGVRGVSVGDRVLLPHGVGTWRRLVVVAAEELVTLPEAVPVLQAAMLRVNPATALCMLREFVSLSPGEWIVQNAANSGVGRSVIQIARACGWRTVNVVRRKGLEAELTQIGADAVVEEGEGLSARILEATGGVAPRLGLNAVGGESALGLAKVLAEEGTHVTYGAMGLQPLRIPNGVLIFKNIEFRGFWVSRWYKKASRDEVAELFSRLVAWAEAGVLHTPVEATYPLESITAALLHAQRGKRSGKILLCP
jgi:NADPH:quinone reductase-like Zn-dependent oxidoreductase